MLEEAPDAASDADAMRHCLTERRHTLSARMRARRLRAARRADTRRARLFARLIARLMMFRFTLPRFA